MAYTTLEKMRLEEYKRNKELQKSGGSSINLPTSTVNSNITLPTAQSGTWFKKAQGNIIQNTLGTTGDALLNLGKGVNSIGEGLKNTVASAFINAASPLTLSEKLLTGEDHLEEWRNKATQDVLNFNPVSDVLDNATEKVDKYSVLGDKSDAIAQGIGYYGGMVALETLGIPWQATSAVTGFGNSYEEAINEDSSRESAVVYSLGSAAAEVASEYLFSGLKLPGTGKTTDKLIEAATDKIRNKVANQLVKFGVNSVGEGVEELISGTASEVMKRLTYMKDEDKSMFQNIGAGINDYYKNQALDEFVSGVLVSAITGASNNLINRTKSTNKNTNLQLTDNSTKNSLSENVITNNNLTNENLYQYIESDNEKINNLRKSAVEIGQFISNNKTTGVMNVAEKLISDKNYNIVFDNTITNENGNMVNAQITTLDNGETEIRLNPSSERAAEFLLIHEVSHGIKTQEMIDLVNDYASKNPEFNQAVKSLEQLYGKDLTSEEVFADVCGQLFGNQEFIMNLSTTKPSIFKRIYNKIVELANKITGNSNEALFIRDLKNKWENAYRTQNNNLNGTQYSTIGIKGAKNLAKNSKSDYYKNLYQNQKKASQIFDNSSEGLENTNIQSKKETGWYKTKYGDWGTLISDKNSKLTQKLEANKTYRLGEILEHNLLYKAYPELKKLKVITADIETTGGYSNVSFLPANTIINEIYIKNSDIAKKDFRKTLLHEINHYIEHKENYDKKSRGANSKTIGKENYRNNVGEIISNETKINADLTQQELNDIILPEQAKQNPKYENIKQKLLESNKKDLIKTGDGKNALQNLEVSVQDKVENTKVANKQNNNIRRINNDIDEELDNSSFSYDNQGRNLTKKQQKFFKDSKARNEQGNLITVYHTTSDEGYQFNEFNPVGTDYYKFGEQTVNYFTDDKDMSGSYANQDYIMADTKKLTSMKQVKDYIKKMNSQGWGSNRTYELIEDNGQYKLINNSKIENSDKTWQQVYDEANEYKKSLTEEELAQFKDMFDKSSDYNYDRTYNIDSYLRNKGYEYGSKQDEIAHKYLAIDNKNATESGIYFDVLMRDAKYRVIGSFDTLEELYRNLKAEGQPLAKRQYEGYVNITNPYIIDAEGRNWNKIESKKDSPTTEKMIYMDSLTKDRLIQLATDSKNRYEKTFAEYQKWLDATNSIDGNLREQNSIEIRSANRVFKEVYADGVKAFINNEYKSPLESGKDDSLNSLYEWRTNNDIISKMYDWDLISENEYNEYQKTLKVSNDVREKLKKLSNQKVKYNEYDADGRNPVVKESTLLDIWGKYQEASKLYFDNGRYEYSLFDNQLLDGYLKDELKSSFPVRDEFGVNDETLKDLFKVALNNFDENYIRSEYNEWSVTNDIVKKIIELNKFGENYDGVIIKNTVDYGGRSETRGSHDLYVTFNSNQFKAVDNTNPTTDPDIRYSQEGNEWQEHLEKNYKATGTRTKFSDMKSNATEQTDNNNTKTQTKKVMNPLEISKITKEDTNTTPILKKINVSTGDGESKFASNIRNKTNMLSESSKDSILSSDDVKFYEKVTNQESLDKAFERLNKNGKSETENWLRKNSENATSVDVAEGWILLKQYQDSIAKETDTNTKNELNRSMVEVAKKLREIGTKAGQTVQAFNILNRLTPEGMVYYAQSELSEAYEKMSQNKTKEWIDSNRDRFELTPEETKFIMDTMQEVQQMEDGYDKRVKLAEIQKLMTDKLPPERGAGIKSWMRISMLFNPKTQVRNVMGNAVIAPVNSFSDLFASMVDKQIAKTTGIRTTGKTNLKNYTKGFKTGLYQSYNDFKKGINTRNMQGNRFEVTQGKSFNDNSIMGKQLNKVDSLLSFMLDAGDRGFYEASFTNSINNQMILNNTTEVTPDMIDIATSEALSRTWQDNNNYTKFVLQTRNALNKINIKGYGLGDVLIPFAKTPANLTKAIVDYSPLGIINAINSGRNLKNSISNGQYNAKMQHQFVQNLGKATAGTMLYILGYALAKAGITSGESDEDKDVKDFMKNTLGVSSYSIKIGDKTFTYDWAQPIAAPLSIMANIVNKQKEGATLTENIISSLDTAGNILLEQSFMESINTVLNNNDGIVSGIQEAILELPSRAVPTLMKQIVDLTDDTQRTTFEYDKPLQTAVNKVKAKIPGLSKTLSPVVDTMGREVKRYGGKNNIFNVFLNPANVNTENISESAQEIYKVYKSTGDKTVMPRVIPYYFDEKGVKRTLTATERSRFQKISGQIIEENVTNLLNNIDYVNMSDVNKSAVLNNLVNYAYNKARYEMFGTEMSNQYNKVNEWTAQGGKVSDYYANKEENDYSLENPKKYNTMTAFDLSYSDYTKYSKEISDIKEQYNDTNSRKYAVWQYIQNQKITKVQKILLYNLCGGYSISNYKDYMFNYINNQNITKAEKQEIWKYLYK